MAPISLPRTGSIEFPRRVVRRKDLDDLFDTDSDLTGFDVDVSPYIRDADDTDIRVFWRQLPIRGDEPLKPIAQELCAAPIGQARRWIRSAQLASGNVFFMRDPQWRRVQGMATSSPPGWVPFRDVPWPGMTLLADVTAGGYREDLGFTGDRKHVPCPVPPLESEPMATPGPAGESDGHDEDPQSQAGHPVSLTEHLRHVTREMSGLCAALGLDEATRSVLIRAARWHDLGKSHDAFQDTMRRGLDGHSTSEGVLLAKTVKGNLRHEQRAYFRHELASALAFLAHEDWSRRADLVAFLIAAHHGKVRMNLRALPKEKPPAEPEGALTRFARGVWEGDSLPPLDLGAGERWPGGRLTLSVMELGWDHTTKESWTERTRELLARFGPFELAWLETLLRIADWRASTKEALGGQEG